MSGCSSENTEPFALRSIDDSMLPEFEIGSIIIVDPGGMLKDGVYVVANHNGEPIFRQMVFYNGKKYLRPLNDIYPTLEYQEGEKIYGVVIQKYHQRKRTHYDR